MFVHTGKYVVNFEDVKRKEVVNTLAEAHAKAQAHVGNTAYSKPFPNEDHYLYGPGNGDTTVYVLPEYRVAR